MNEVGEPPAQNKLLSSNSIIVFPSQAHGAAVADPFRPELPTISTPHTESHDRSFEIALSYFNEKVVNTQT